MEQPRNDRASYPQDCPRVGELGTLAFRPAVQMAQVDDDLAVGVEFDLSAVHGPRRRTFKVDAFGVIAAAMTRALELVLAGLPVWGAAKMRTHRRDHENAFGVSHDPDPVLALELGIDAESEVGGVADLEPGLGLVQRALEEEAEEHQES